MNRRLKLLVLLLLTAVLVLSAAIASLTLAGSENTAEPSGQQTPAEGAAIDRFVGQNGRWGVRSASGRVLIEPAWYYLRIMNDSTVSDSVLIARQNDGRLDRFGLIRSSGEQLVPFLYTSFEQKGDDVWLAELEENGRKQYHLYHSNGTRWLDEGFDRCEFDSRGDVRLTAGTSTDTARLTENGVQWRSMFREYPVGLHRLTMQMQPPLPAERSVLDSLGKAAADYLNLLFVTREDPDTALISAEDAAAVRKAYCYKNCTLLSAYVRRVKLLPSDSFPQYLVELALRYRRVDTFGDPHLVETSCSLTISRNTAGSYNYSAFYDAQLAAAGESALS